MYCSNYLRCLARCKLFLGNTKINDSKTTQPVHIQKKNKKTWGIINFFSMMGISIFILKCLCFY